MTDEFAELNDVELTERMDECFDVLYASPSEKTVNTAHELANLIKAYRSMCCNALLQNMAALSQTILADLKKFGVIFDLPKGDTK